MRKSTLIACVLAALVSTTAPLAHAAASAGVVSVPPAPADSGHGAWQHPAGRDGDSQHHRWHAMGERPESMWVLHQLSLSAEQHAQIRGLVRNAWMHGDAVREETVRDRDALMATPPNDPGYPSLVATAQQHASARIQERAALWAQIYAILTPEQQARIPGLVQQRAAERAAHRAHRPHEGKGMHPPVPPSAQGATSGPV